MPKTPKRGFAFGFHVFLMGIEDKKWCLGYMAHFYSLMILDIPLEIFPENNELINDMHSTLGGDYLPTKVICGGLMACQWCLRLRRHV